VLWTCEFKNVILQQHCGVDPKKNEVCMAKKSGHVHMLVAKISKRMSDFIDCSDVHDSQLSQEI